RTLFRSFEWRHHLFRIHRRRQADGGTYLLPAGRQPHNLRAALYRLARQTCSHPQPDRPDSPQLSSEVGVAPLSILSRQSRARPTTIPVVTAVLGNSPTKTIAPSDD